MDTEEWNPATDKYLDVKYNKSNVFAGKAAAKAALQAEAGLDVDESIPLFGYIGRLEEQKGVDILMKVCCFIFTLACTLLVTVPLTCQSPRSETLPAHQVQSELGFCSSSKLINAHMCECCGQKVNSVCW